MMRPALWPEKERMANKERFHRPERGHTLKREGTIYDGQADREAKVAAALSTLEAGIASLTDADSFKQYLTSMARFHRRARQDESRRVRWEWEDTAAPPRRCQRRVAAAYGTGDTQYPLPSFTRAVGRAVTCAVTRWGVGVAVGCRAANCGEC
jgi:hypothetical protein